jgi:3-methylcrotonyl-CoA carboxylase alpha subunit
MEKIFIINNEEIKVQDYKNTSDGVTFSLNGKADHYKLLSKEGKEMILDNGNRIRAAVGTPNRDGEMMVIANGREAVMIEAGKKMKKAGAHVGGLKSPMPGKIFKILKEAGSEVKKGEPLMILEAMKMEHSIRSDKDGIIKKIFFKVGELVQGGVILAEVE